MLERLSQEDRIRLLLALIHNNFASFLEKCFTTLNPGSSYVDNWHIIAIAYHLEQIRLGKLKRLIICMPPRSLKSISASIAFPAFVHAHDPTKQIIAVSYASDLAANFQNDYRTILNSSWFQQIFPNIRISRRKDSESEVHLTKRGSRLATSVGGTPTGRGADLIIIDDPLKAADAYSEAKRTAANDWFGSTLMSRLNDKKNGAIVIVTQRVHANDLVGHVLETSGDDWTVLELPAIAEEPQRIQIGDNRWHQRFPGDLLHPEREPREILDRLQRDIGPDAFSAQYQQRPVPPGGAMFKRDWLKYYPFVPEPTEDDIIYQSWDTASKTGPANDWSVCTTWRYSSGRYYLLDLVREKLDYPSLKDLAIEQAEFHNPWVVLIEETGVGIGLIEELIRNGISAIGVTPKESKEARAAVQTAKFASGRVLFPERASWLSELEAELLAFPGGRHDDQVDSIIHALAYDVPEDGGVDYICF